MAERTLGTEERHQIVVTNGPRDAISGPVEGPHCDGRPAQTAFVHVRCNLTREAREAKCATETDSAVAEAVAHARLPVRGLGHGTTSRLSHNDHRGLGLHFQGRVFSGCGSEELGSEQEVISSLGEYSLKEQGM